MHGLNIIYNVLDAPDKTMALLGFYILTLRAHLNSTEYKTSTHTICNEQSTKPSDQVLKSMLTSFALQ